MAQRGNTIGISERINCLKGWARSLGQPYGKEIPLTPKPATAKTQRKLTKKR